jgi:hypothetical protein
MCTDYEEIKYNYLIVLFVPKLLGCYCYDLVPKFAKERNATFQLNNGKNKYAEFYLSKLLDPLNSIDVPRLRMVKNFIVSQVPVILATQEN